MTYPLANKRIRVAGHRGMVGSAIAPVRAKRAPLKGYINAPAGISKHNKTGRERHGS